MDPLKVAILGLKHQHPRWYHPLWAQLPDLQPVAISDADADFLRAEQSFFGLDAETDWRRLLARRDVDIALIFLPHAQMPEAVEAALAAGKHVFVEKPCAADALGAVKIAAAAAAHPDRVVSAPYCWRDHAVSRRIKAAVDSGELGKITALECRLNAGSAHRYVRDNCSWLLKRGERGGPLWNLGVHWIDWMRWLTGREYRAAQAATSGPETNDPPREIEDNAHAIFTLDGGAHGVLDVSYAIPDEWPGKRDIFVAVRGTEGALAWAPAWDGNVDELLLVSARAPGRPAREEIVSRIVPGYAGEMGWRWLNDYAAAVRAGGPPNVTVDDIVATANAAEAAYRSAASGRREEL